MRPSANSTRAPRRPINFAWGFLMGLLLTTIAVALVL